MSTASGPCFLRKSLSLLFNCWDCGGPTMESPNLGGRKTAAEASGGTCSMHMALRSSDNGATSSIPIVDLWFALARHRHLSLIGCTVIVYSSTCPGPLAGDFDLRPSRQVNVVQDLLRPVHATCQIHSRRRRMSLCASVCLIACLACPPCHAKTPLSAQSFCPPLASHHAFIHTT